MKRIFESFSLLNSISTGTTLCFLLKLRNLGSGAVLRPHRFAMIYGFAPMTIARRCGLFGGKVGTGRVERLLSMRKRAITSASTLRSSPTLRSTPLKYWSIRIVLFACVIGIPAPTMASLISLARSAASWPPGPVHSSSIIVGANGFNNDLSFSFCSAVSRRPAILASSFSRSIRSDSAALLASAASCSARAARSFALAISNWNPSAFFRATSAAFNACAARSFSWLASCSVLAARSYAPADRSIANAASFRASLNRMSLNVWRVPSALETNPSVANSPMTPKIIKNHPSAVSTFIQLGVWRSLRSSESASQYSSSLDLRVNMPIMSWTTSGPSRPSQRQQAQCKTKATQSTSL